jgi:hypothetical protein
MGGNIAAVMALLIPITIFMIPIIAILTNHQRKMAELMRHQHPQANPNELLEMRREMQELKQLVAQQTIQMDDFLSNQRKLSAAPPPVPQDLQARIGS